MRSAKMDPGTRKFCGPGSDSIRAMHANPREFYIFWALSRGAVAEGNPRRGSRPGSSWRFQRLFFLDDERVLEAVVPVLARVRLEPDPLEREPDFGEVRAEAVFFFEPERAVFFPLELRVFCPKREFRIPEAAPIRAPETAPATAPATARLRVPPDSFTGWTTVSTTAFLAAVTDPVFRFAIGSS